MMREKACKNKNLIHSSVLGLRCMLVFTQMSASDKEVRYFYFSNCSFQALNVRGRSEFSCVHVILDSTKTIHTHWKCIHHVENRQQKFNGWQLLNPRYHNNRLRPSPCIFYRLSVCRRSFAETKRLYLGKTSSAAADGSRKVKVKLVKFLLTQSFSDWDINMFSTEFT